MYRTYELTEEEKNMPFTSMWAGDCMVYTVYETEEEKAKELARLARIDKEAEEAKKAYYNTLKEENTMTREKAMNMTNEELKNMTMKELKEVAEALGIKINTKGKKADALNTIYTQFATAEEVTEETTAPETEEVTEEPAPKKERKTRTKKTFESLLAVIPVVIPNVSITPNGKKRNAVHLRNARGTKRIFGYDGAVVVVTNEKYLHGVVEVAAEKRNYGYRVEPTAANMIAIQRNYIATITQ